MEPDERKEKISDELKCTGCGAILEFKPGTHMLKCAYCGAENPIEQEDAQIEEIDYEQFVAEQLDREEKIEVVNVKCESCGASITLDANVTADECPYCAASIVVSGGSTSTVLKPKSLLPFKIDRRQAAQSFRQWINKLWFAPSDLKKNTRNEKIGGIYLPYWTYDAHTYTDYTGQRGIYRYRTESYTTTDEQGRTVTKQRQVRYTEWYPAAGRVTTNFDDILVIASNSLPVKYTERLEPWNLKELVSFDDKYLSGFRSEAYQVDVAAGLAAAKDKMTPVIRKEVYRDIGGDEQRIFTMNTSYESVTFKHILLPIWISSYRYKDKVYRFMINGQSGEVQGERPYSAWKIAAAVLAAILVIVAAILLFSK